MGKPKRPAGASRSAAPDKKVQSVECISSVDEAVVAMHAAGEIARHWYEQKNWARLETVLADREMLAGIFACRPAAEVLEWWLAIERETGASVEERYEAIWRRWELNRQGPRTREETRRLAMHLVELLFNAERCGGFAERLLRAALRIDAEDHGDESSQVGTHFHMLARLVQARGDVVLAEEACRRSIVIAERTDGPDSWTVSLRLNTLAGIHLGREDYRQAEWLLRRSLSIAEGIEGLHSPDLLTVLENLVEALMLQDDPVAAEPYARRIVLIAESLAQPDLAAVGRYVRGLANIIERRGDHVEALPLRRRALAIAEKELGPLHPITLGAVLELAETLRNLKSVSEAEVLLRRAITLADDNADAPDGLLLAILTSLGRILERQEKSGEATPFLERALAMLEDPKRTSDPHSGQLIVVLQKLGVAYLETSRFDDADSCLLRAKMIAEASEPPQPLLLADVLSTLGELRAIQKRVTEAEELFKNSLSIRREHVDDGDPDLVVAEQRLAELRADAPDPRAISGAVAL